MTNKTYKEMAEELMGKGYIPNGRYEHIRNKDSVPVIYLWCHIKGEKPDIVLFCETNELGELTTICNIFTENII